VIAFDNTGVGQSSGKTPDNVAQMVADSEQFIAALGFADVDLLEFSQSIRWPLTTGPLASFVRVLQSFGFFILALGRGAPTIVRTVVEQMERGFASFADVPYQDAQTKRELVQMLGDLEETPRPIRRSRTGRRGSIAKSQLQNSSSRLSSSLARRRSSKADDTGVTL
jgi:hypothetical protein